MTDFTSGSEPQSTEFLSFPNGTDLLEFQTVVLTWAVFTSFDSCGFPFNAKRSNELDVFLAYFSLIERRMSKAQTNDEAVIPGGLPTCD